MAIAEAFRVVGFILSATVLPAMKELWNTLSTKLFPAFQQLWQTVSPLLIPVLKVLGATIGIVLVGALEVFIYSLNLVALVFTGIMNMVRTGIDLFKQLGNIIDSVVKKLSGVSIGEGVKKLTGGFSDLFRANGGSVSAGKPYIVGDGGEPEWFIPKQNGTIVPFSQVPNQQPGGNSTNTSVQFTGNVSIASDYDVSRIGEVIAQQIKLARMGA